MRCAASRIPAGGRSAMRAKRHGARCEGREKTNHRQRLSGENMAARSAEAPRTIRRQAGHRIVQGVPALRLRLYRVTMNAWSTRLMLRAMKAEAEARRLEREVERLKVETKKREREHGETLRALGGPADGSSR